MLIQTWRSRSHCLQTKAGAKCASSASRSSHYSFLVRYTLGCLICQRHGLFPSRIFLAEVGIDLIWSLVCESSVSQWFPRAFKPTVPAIDAIQVSELDKGTP